MRTSVLASTVAQGVAAVGAAMLLAIASGPALSAQAPQQLTIRELNGTVACVVRLPASRSASPAADLMAVDIRVPPTPDATLLSRLPAQRRDYSSLPIAVFLVQAPEKGEVVSSRLPQVTPIAAELTPRGLPEIAEGVTFVRVEFARAHLRAGVDLVAERTAAAGSGEHVTTQTRCRIRAVDALVWR